MLLKIAHDAESLPPLPRPCLPDFRAASGKAQEHFREKRFLHPSGHLIAFCFLSKDAFDIPRRFRIAEDRIAQRAESKGETLADE